MKTEQPTEIALSDKEHAALKAFADEHGMTVDEAAAYLASRELSRRYRQNGIRPANVYQMARRTKQ